MNVWHRSKILYSVISSECGFLSEKVVRDVGALIQRGVNVGAGARIYAGSYRSRPRGSFGVCLEKEFRGMGCHEFVDWPDFGLPRDALHLEIVMEKVELHLRRGNLVYVGCRGGYGRTGTFLALLVKRNTYLDPIAYVRREYRARAIETSGQEQYIMDW
jgi:hypothetical protein